MLCSPSFCLQRVRELYSTLCGVCHHCLQAVGSLKRDRLVHPPVITCNMLDTNTCTMYVHRVQAEFFYSFFFNLDVVGKVSELFRLTGGI